MNPNLLYDVALQRHAERLTSAEHRRLTRSLRPPSRVSFLHRLRTFARRHGVNSGVPAGRQRLVVR